MKGGRSQCLGRQTCLFLWLAVCEVIDLTIDSGSDFESDISAINSP